MKCSEVMKKRGAVAPQNESVRRIALLMGTHHSDTISLLNGDREVVGTVSKQDIIVRGVATGLDLNATHAIELAETPVLSVGVDDDTTVAEQKMVEAHAKRIDVVNALNEYQGEITLASLQSPAVPEAAAAAH